MKYKKGRVIALTEGEYSEYQVLAVIRLRCDIDTDELLKRYLKICPDGKEDPLYCREAFINYLLNVARVAEEIDCNEWFLGSGFGLEGFQSRGKLC